MKEFFDYIVKNLVDQPDAVDIQIVEGEKGTLIEVRVAPEDVAKVVGRKGRIINSLRTLAITVGARFGQRVRLELRDGAYAETTEKLVN
ncbi:MAG: KH domain-containing protein [Verrucomicrobia bacterium]|nr:KH domain-containing protein [Verrucomicrobiota bacterium]